MKYTLNQERSTEKTKVWVEDKTGNETVLEMIFVDAMGNQWYGFKDLFQIPYMRRNMASKIILLYQTGFILEDIKAFTKGMKDILKSNDPEKYEKTYMKILEMEALAEQTMDPVKQDLSLATVYILAEGEMPHTWIETEAAKKMKLWKQDPEAVAFFLSWLVNAMNSYIKPLNASLPIVSKETKKVKRERTKGQSELLKALQ